MPLIEITVGQGTFTSEEKLRLTKAVQKALVDEYEAIKGRTPKTTLVFIREIDMESVLIDGLTVAEIRAKQNRPSR